MLDRVQLDKLSDEALIKTFLLSLVNPLSDDVVDEMSTRDIWKQETLLSQILSSYSKTLSLKEKIDLASHLRERPIMKEALQIALDYKILNQHAQAFNGNLNSLSVLIAIVTCLYGLNRLSDITPTIWGKIVDGIIIDYQPREGIVEKFINAARHLRRILQSTYADDRYGEQYSMYIGSARGKYTTTTTRLKLENPEYIKWIEAFSKWLGTLLLKSTKDYNTAFKHFSEYLIESVKITDPSEFFMLENKPDFYDWLTVKRVKTKVRYSKVMYDFSMWYLQEYLSEEEDGELNALGYPLFSYTRINTVIKDKDTTAAQRNNESIKQSMPTKWMQICKQILREDDFKWPRTLDFEYYRDGNDYVWCPSITILFLIMLEIPLRKIQVAQLDSGEGDELKFDIGPQRWVSNPSKTKGYWRKIGVKNINRGVLRQHGAMEKNSVSLYINTNKTQDREHGFSDASGYVIPWHNKTVIELVSYLRTWQENNNPQDIPARYRDLPKNTFSSSPTESAIDLIPDRFYLFRSPCVSSGFKFAPPADFMFFRYWYHLMDELERRLRENGESIEIITKREKNGKPTGSIFTPHGLRVSGLTSFLEAGVPIEVLSKIVAGHASILMTLHYIKFNNAHISDLLNSAQVEIENKQQMNYTNWLKNASWDEAQKYSIFNNPDTFDVNRWASDNSSSLWENRQIGLCPNSGTRCSEGGSLLRKSGNHNKDVYGAVQGAQGNCIMCRFFVTGAPWLIPMWLKTNNLLTEAQRLSKDLEKSRKQLEALTSDRYEIRNKKGAEAIPASLQTQIKQHEALVDTKTTLVDRKLQECHASYRLLQKIRTMADPSAPNSPILQKQNVSDEQEFAETSDFRKLDMLVQASRLYPSFENENYEKDRDHFIDTIMFNAGLTPITLSKLSDNEKKVATDAASKYLTTTLNDHELNLLEQNAISLRDLGYEDNLKQTIEKHGVTQTISITHGPNAV